ncbi:hypothetical protein Tco_0919114 [Tanacetum coccineum]
MCLVAPYPLSPLFPFSPPAVESEVHRMKQHYRVVIALASFLGFGMVLLGKELELEGWLVFDMVELDKLDFDGFG